MPERVQGDALVDPRRHGRSVAGAVELAGGQRLHRVAAREQPPLRPLCLPVGTQQLEQRGRQHHVAVLAALALLDPNDHARAVDIGDLERDHLGGAQARAIGDAQRRPILEAWRSFQEARHFLRAQNRRQLARLADEGHVRRDVFASKRHREEEAQRRHRRVQAGSRDAARRQMQLIAPQILRARLVRRAAKENGEVPDGADVGCLGPRRESADRHIFDHAPA